MQKIIYFEGKNPVTIITGNENSNRRSEEKSMSTKMRSMGRQRPFDDIRRHKTYYIMLIPMVVFVIFLCRDFTMLLWTTTLSRDCAVRSAASVILSSFFPEEWTP